MTDEHVRLGVQRLKAIASVWSPPQAELPADSLLEAAVCDILALRDTSVATLEADPTRANLEAMLKELQSKGASLDDIGSLLNGKIYESGWRAQTEPTAVQEFLYRSLRALWKRSASHKDIAIRMDALAADGWCVTIRRLPPGMGWTVEGERSEYEVSSENRTIGTNLWYCKAQDVSGSALWRRSQWGLGETIEDALRKVEEAVASETRQGKEASTARGDETSLRNNPASTGGLLPLGDVLPEAIDPQDIVSIAL